MWDYSCPHAGKANKQHRLGRTSVFVCPWVHSPLNRIRKARSLICTNCSLSIKFTLAPPWVSSISGKKKSQLSERHMLNTPLVKCLEVSDLWETEAGIYLSPGWLCAPHRDELFVCPHPKSNELPGNNKKCLTSTDP